MSLFRTRKRTAPHPSQREPAPAGGEDLLALSEEAAFDESVRQARSRAGAPKKPAEPVRKEADDEIVWDDLADVYRPTPVESRDLLQRLALPDPPRWQQNRSCIVIAPETLADIRQHLASDTSIELGGLLAGQVFADAALSSYLVLIRAAFPAHNGAATSTGFEYTSASWAEMTPGLHGMDPDWTVVGSYHSHPDHGVFLSSIDLETQASVFSQPWQVALVIDPIRDEIGFFIGEQGMPCTEWREGTLR